MLTVKRLLALTLTVTLLSLQLTGVVTSLSFSASKNISLQSVMTQGLENSSKINSANIKIFEKKIAIKQAQKSVKGEGLKLLRLFAKKTTFNKDIAKKSKVQKSQFEHQLAIKELAGIKLSEKYRLEELYLKAYLSQELKRKKQIRLNEATIRLTLAAEALKKGDATQEDYEAQQALVDVIKAEVTALNIEYADKITAVGDTSGKDLSNGSYTVNYELDQIYLPEWLLPAVLDKGLRNDWSLISTGENIKFMTFYVNAISRLYNGRFSSGRMGKLNSLVAGGIGEIGDLELMSSYENLIDSLIGRWGDKWKAYLEIPLLFVTIKIPKFFRFDEFEGVRYIEDARYVLMLEIFKTKQLIAIEEELKKAKIAYVTDLFAQINNLDYDYTVMKADYSKLAVSYTLDQNAYSKGLIEADVLIEKNQELIELDQKIFDALGTMNEKILEMDFITAGYYRKLAKSEVIKNAGIKPAPFKKPSVDSLLEAIEQMEEENKTLIASWSITPLAETMNSEMKVEIQGDSPVTHYQLFNRDGLKMSEKLEIKKSFIHLELLFSDKTALLVQLFEQDKLLYVGTLEGYGEKGVLEVTEQ